MCNHSELSNWEILKGLGAVLLPLSSLIVAITALVLSKKISFKKTIKDRQLDLIYDLIELLSKSEVNFYWKDNTHSGGISGMSLYHFIFANFTEKNKYLFDRNTMFYQVNSFEDYKFRRLMGNPLLPSEIYAVLDRFSPGNAEIVSFEEMEMTNDFVAHIKLGVNMKEARYQKSESKDLKTFEDFHNLVVEIFDTVNTWLKKYDATDLMFKKNLMIR